MKLPRWPNDVRVAAAVLCAVCIGLVVCCSGCATVPQYGDGKIGNIPLDPAVQSLATALNARAPGTGDYVAKWFASSGVDRVPPGYAIRWTAYLDGKAIDETAIVRVPSLVVREGATPIPPPTSPDTNAINAAVDAVLGSGIINEVPR